MFLEQMKRKNMKLIEAAFSLHKNGDIYPDTFLIDMDTLLKNARNILLEAKKYDIDLYFMLKQLGRNPYIAKKLVEMGYCGAVVVDFKEALIMMENKIPIGNIGHLVQIPNAMLEKIILYQPEIITVYSLEKIQQIDKIARKLNLKQKIMLRIYGANDKIYSGQEGGFSIEELPLLIGTVKKLKGIVISGITSFPTFQYDEKSLSIVPTSNLYTLIKAEEILEENNIVIKQKNFPSITCSSSIKKIAYFGGTHGEPGHGLSGTTPLHTESSASETPCVIYVSEVSHNFRNKAYCYGGGYYKNSKIKSAYVGESLNSFRELGVICPSDKSVDYYLELENQCEVGDTVILAFRCQIFTTRSDVVLLEGLYDDEQYKIIARYDHQGKRI